MFPLHFMKKNGACKGLVWGPTQVENEQFLTTCSFEVCHLPVEN